MSTETDKLFDKMLAGIDESEITRIQGILALASLSHLMSLTPNFGLEHIDGATVSMCNLFNKLPSTDKKLLAIAVERHAANVSAIAAELRAKAALQPHP